MAVRLKRNQLYQASPFKQDHPSSNSSQESSKLATNQTDQDDNHLRELWKTVNGSNLFTQVYKELPMSPTLAKRINTMESYQSINNNNNNNYSSASTTTKGSNPSSSSSSSTGDPSQVLKKKNQSLISEIDEILQENEALLLTNLTDVPNNTDQNVLLDLQMEKLGSSMKRKVNYHTMRKQPKVHDLEDAPGGMDRRLTNDTTESQEYPSSSDSIPESNKLFRFQRIAARSQAREQAMEEKLKRLAVSVKVERESHSQIIQSLEERAKTAEHRAEELDKKLSQLLIIVKQYQSSSTSPRSKRISEVQLGSVQKEVTRDREVRGYVTELETNKKILELNETIKSLKHTYEGQSERIKFLEAQLEQSRSENQNQKHSEKRTHSSTDRNKKKGRDDLVHEEASKIQALARQSMKESNKSQPLVPKEQTTVKRPTRDKPVRVVALFDFEPAKDDDLGFEEGDILTLRKKYSNGWWLAQDKQGQVGRVPSNFVEELDHASENKVKAATSFQGELPFDLTFKKGELITILKSEDDWWIGELENGTVGYLPSTFVANPQQA